MKLLGRSACLLVTICLLLFFGSCESDKGKHIPDVSNIRVDLNIVRFEEALFGLDTTNLSSGLETLQQLYPDFYSVYFQQVLGLPLDQLDSLAALEAVKGFLTFPAVQSLADTTGRVFRNFEPIRGQLSTAFQYYKYYFPEKQVPDVYTYISEYTYGAFVSDPNILAIGLDFFLGADYPYYNPNFFPNYIKRTMTAEYIPLRAMEALIADLAGENVGQRMLDLMIHNGQQLYVLDRLLPHTADSIKLGYTAAQTKWVNENESQIWAYFLSEDLLYSTEFKEIRKLVDHSPNSPGMPPEAPGRTANWLGWKIVESYMQQYPETSLSALLEISDAQQFLEKSRYKPKI